MTSIKMPNGMGTPEDQLQITIATVGDYLSGEQLRAWKAQTAAQQMHSMQDWTIGHRLSDFGCKDHNDFRNRIYKAEPRLAVIRDVANATKHGGSLKNNNRVLDEIKTTGSFSRAFSREFDRVRMELHVTAEKKLHMGAYLRNGEYLEMNETLEDCLEFWVALYESGQIPDNHSERQKTGAISGSRRKRIKLPDEINTTANQLAIAEQMAEQSAHESTPAATYLAATAIAPLEHWGYEDLRIPMEFPNKRDFRQYLYGQSPAIRATRELAQAAKSGARVMGNVGRIVIALKDGRLCDSVDTFGAVIAFWQKILAEHTR